MSRPQQPEIARSGRTDVDPDHAADTLDAKRAPRSKGKTGPVPPENQPGHHPSDEQDKPDLDAFAARFAADEGEPAEVSGDSPGQERDSGVQTATGGRDPEPVYMRCALYPARLAVHVAKWSREYFRRH